MRGLPDAAAGPRRARAAGVTRAALLLLAGCAGDPVAPVDDNAGLARTATLESWQSLTLAGWSPRRSRSR